MKYIYSFDRNAKLKDIEISLAKPNRDIIDNLYGVDNISLVLNYEDGIHEISFTAYTKASDFNRKLIDNPLIPKLKQGYLIKAVYDKEVMWFIITGNDPSSSLNEESVSITGYLHPYQLGDKRISYEKKSVTISEAANDCLHQTGLKLGHVTPSLNGKFRQFDISSSSKLDFIKEICETYEAKVQYDSDKDLVHFYEKDELSTNKGFVLSEYNYVESISKSSNYNEFVTRLHVRGSEGLTINSINPTGQSYIDDFSYYLYPFKRDENRNVLSHSEFMSDDLCHAILDYNELINANSGKFKRLLENRSEKEKEISSDEIKLVDLNNELDIAKDALHVVKEHGVDSTAPYLQAQDIAEKAVNDQKKVIDNLRSSLSEINLEISNLNTLLKLENNLNESQLNALYKDFFKEQEWSNDSYFDETDLYEEAHVEIKKRNRPPVEVTTSLANFFMMISEQHNWDMLGLGDIVTAYHKRLDINEELTVNRISLNFKDNTIDVSLTNAKRVLSTEDKILEMLYTVEKSKTEFNKRKDNYNATFENFRIRNNQISAPVESVTLPSSPLSYKLNDDGTANITIKWEYSDDYEQDKYNIDGFRVYIYSSDSNEKVLLGSNISGEESKPVPREQRSLTFNSLTANKYYFLGVMAYRTVDPNINSTGVIKSEIIQPKASIEARSSVMRMSLFNYNDDLNDDVFEETEEELENSYEDEDDLNEDGSPKPPFPPRDPNAKDVYGLRPTDKININGKLNGTEIHVGNEPENPEPGAMWTDFNGNTHIFDGIKWTSYSNDILNKVKEVEKEVERVTEEISEVKTDVEDHSEQLALINSKLDSIGSSLDIKSLSTTNLSKAFNKLRTNKGSTICCIGTSITYGHDTTSDDIRPAEGFDDRGNPHVQTRASITYPESLQKRLSFVYGENRINVINKGFSGDGVKRGFERWNVSGADFCLMDYGANDAMASWVEHVGDVTQFISGYRKLIERELLNGTAVILLTPTKHLITENSDTGTRTVVDTFSKAVKLLASEYNLPYIEGHELIANYGADSYSDQSHRNGKGYDILGSRIACFFIGEGFSEEAKIGGDSWLGVRPQIDNFKLSNGAIITSNNGTPTPNEVRLNEGVTSIIRNGQSITYSFYAVEDGLVVIPSLYTTNNNIKLTLSLDFGTEQAQWGNLWSALDDQITDQTYREPSVISVEKPDLLGAYRRHYNKSLVKTSNQKHLKIVRRGWHSITISCETQSPELLYFLGLDFMSLDSFRSRVYTKSPLPLLNNSIQTIPPSLITRTSGQASLVGSLNVINPSLPFAKIDSKFTPTQTKIFTVAIKENGNSNVGFLTINPNGDLVLISSNSTNIEVDLNTVNWLIKE